MLAPKFAPECRYYVPSLFANPPISHDNLVRLITVIGLLSRIFVFRHVLIKTVKLPRVPVC